MSNPLLSSINSGEFSPRIEARVDFERYPNAAKRLRNMMLYPQGGVTRRPGSRFIKEVKTSSAETTLIPFEFSEEDAYMIEAGDGYFRFYRRQARLEVETTDAAVANGTFAAGIASWTNSSTGGAAIAHDVTNQRLQLTGAAGGIAWASQGITINVANINKVHVLRFTTYIFGGGKIKFQVGTAATTANILEETELGNGYHSISFTPGATTFYIQFKNNDVPVRNTYVDNVSFLSNAPLELTATYATADLPDLQYFQSADIVYITHPDYPTAKIERRATYSWSLIEVFWDDGPYLDPHDGEDLAPLQLMSNADFNNGLTDWTDNSTGSGFVVYNESGEFAELDPGASGGGNVAIMRGTTTVVSGKKHIAHILVVAAGPITVNIGSGAGLSDYIATTQTPGWMTYEFTTTGTALHVEFRHPNYTHGRAGIGGCRVFSEDAKLLEVSATTGTVTVEAYGFSPFTSDDLGRLLRFEYPGQEAGYGVITAYTDTNTVTLLILRKIASVSPTESWRFGAFGGTQGFAKTIGFFDGRTVLANTELQPNTIWFTQSGQLENMRPDSYVGGDNTQEDDDAINITLRSTKLNPIFWLAGAKNLMVGTAGGEWVVQSGDSVVTPTDISAKLHAEVSCADMKSVTINQTILFADRARRRVHDLAFNFQEDTFLATDMTILADHVLVSPTEQLVYQRNPFSMIWARREDGRAAILAYNKQHQILGWSHVLMGGEFGDVEHGVIESVAVIPGAADDDQVYDSDERTEVWLIVKRTINGNTERYIEVLEGMYEGPLREDYETEALWVDAIKEDQKRAFYVDCGITYEGAATALITGLDHLEGETVKVFADGVVLDDRVVQGGNITLNTPSEVVQVGLAYKHSYESLKIVAQATKGTSVNKVKIITALGLVLLDVAECSVTTVEYDEDGRRIHDLIDIQFLRDWMPGNEAVPLFSGERHVETEGVYSRDTRIYIEGDSPTPFTILGIAPQMEVRDV
jgi:hypothetical protein